MSRSTDSDFKQLAQHAIDSGEHYVEAVANLAERKTVVSVEDILASNGTKLIPRGTRLDGRLRERLLRHKLLKPLDRSLVAGESVSAASLAQEAATLVKTIPYLRQLATRSGDPLAMQHGLARVPLTAEMAFNLTVAKEQQPRLYLHLLTVALITHYLALRLELSERDSGNLLAAALFHDLGELHTDPALLEPNHRVSDDERRYIYVHPITGYLIASEVAGIAPSVCTAILQHQERLDGSGYPYGLRGNEIGQFARIIGIADVCASILSRHGNSERLSTLVRLNRQKYDAKMLGLLQEGLAQESDGGAYVGAGDVSRMSMMADLLRHWGELRASLPAADRTRPDGEIGFLLERMVGLRSMLVQFGFDPDSPEMLLELARLDTRLAAELSAALDEMHWQFSDLHLELERRRDTLYQSLSAEQKRLLQDWIQALDAYTRSE